MTLQRKLMAAFGALATIALLVAVTALYLTLGWQDAAAQAERHYRRSLLLQSIRADTFQALKEVDDALTGDVRDARDDFERILAPAQRHFREWQALADTSDEREEIARVRNGYDNLVAYARRVFELLPMDRAAAEKLIDLEIDTRAHEQFRVLTENGVQADGRKRDEIGAETRRVRTTTQVMLAVSMVSILSLTLLLAGFIAQDLFRPLRGAGDAGAPVPR
jgi:hypothetical protein